MDQLNSIEAKLQRLVPPSLSEDGLERLEQTIDSLAGEISEAGVDGDLVRDQANATSKVWMFGKIAAVLALLSVPAVMIPRMLKPDVDQSLAVINLPMESPVFPEMVLLKSTKLIDGQEDDGLIVPSDGTAPHYRYRYRVIDEEQVQDPETGAVITLRQPRQEVITIPVTQF